MLVTIGLVLYMLWILYGCVKDSTSPLPPAAKGRRTPSR